MYKFDTDNDNDISYRHSYVTVSTENAGDENATPQNRGPKIQDIEMTAISLVSLI